jgi:hypothetical protein
MSYDYILFKPDANLSLDEAVNKMLSEQEESEEINSGPVDVEKEKQKAALASALMATSRLDKSQFEYQAIAKMEGISEAEARVRYRHIELNEATHETGIQITLYDDKADITVPYWHEGKAALEVLQEIWNYLKIIQRETKYVTYDPQIYKVLNLDSDFEKVLAMYGSAMGIASKAILELIGKQRPWWKFW